MSSKKVVLVEFTWVKRGVLEEKLPEINFKNI